MKNMFFLIKLKSVLKFIFGFVLCVSVGVVSSLILNKINQTNSSSKLNYTIVLDAGHGGIDGGSVGQNTSAKESDLNLAVTKKLESLLTSFGFNVVLTRSTSDGLYSQFADNKKLDDMQKRKEKIIEAKANMLISIHMNSFPNQYERGAQVFYQVGEETSKTLAQSVQDELRKNLVEAREFCNHSDLYILQCISSPSIVVEGGFLSNPEEEALLVTESYQEKIAYSIFCGVIKFFEKENAVN